MFTVSPSPFPTNPTQPHLSGALANPSLSLSPAGLNDLQALHITTVTLWHRKYFFVEGGGGRFFFSYLVFFLNISKRIFF